ncbi:mannitol dehydrogenase family protein [Salinifilum aidingensis]
MDALNLRNLELLPASARPDPDPRSLTTGIVHFGIGGFHRAHQAVYTEDAMAAAGDPRWAITAVTQRSPRMRDQLAPQDGLYAVAATDGAHARYRVVGAVREVLDGTAQLGTALHRIADPAVTAVTLTVTEKAYRLDPATDRLDTADPEIRADAAGRAPQTVLGRLVAGLQRRRSADAGPITVLCCDNMSGNGAVLRQAVADYCALLPDAVGEWIAANVAFPSTAVDRIVPATTEQDRRAVAEALSVADAAPVVTERFTQWVVEEGAAAALPAWEKAGALFVPDVGPYERRKLRTLNAAHSLLAYLGCLSGADTIAAAVGVDEFARAARRLALHEAGPALPRTTWHDYPELESYVDAVLARFANPALRHTTTQVAADGSRKIPPRLVGTIRAAYARGAEPAAALLTTAAWVRCVLAGKRQDGAPLDIDDPAAPAMRTAAAGRCGRDAVRAALAAAGLDRELLDTEHFLEAVTAYEAELARGDVRAVVRDMT